MSEPFHRNAAANAVGGTIAGILVALLIWVATKWGGDANPALAGLELLVSGAGGVAFFVIYRRYAAILARREPRSRQAVWRPKPTRGG